jgi:uncharacterized protein (DUF433 family)
MANAAAETYPHISSDPEICGGRACITGTRVKVMDIVFAYVRGRTPAELQDDFSRHLTLAEVHAALAYYYDHQAEIDAAFEEDDQIIEQWERDRL